MARPVRPWFRFYTEAFSDRKLLRLSPQQRWIWVAILGAARESPTPGTLLIAEGIPMTTTELARYADVRERDVVNVLPNMVSLGMLSIDGDQIRVLNWDARQFESDNITARTQAHRERSREQDGNVPKNVRGNTPETETETDKKKTSSSSGRAGRGTRITEDWIPSEKARASLADQFPQIDLKNEHAKFIDYWLAKSGKDATKVDWEATFRNWIRFAAERQPARFHTTKPEPEFTNTEDMFAQLGRMQSEYARSHPQ